MLKFYSKSKDGQCLSNFSPHQIEIDGKIYPTGEHAFHGEKYKQTWYNVERTNDSYSQGPN